ncbi:hypothetical protein [Cryobacterium cryoconiti]|uniref:Uncharacterized protein n=1 Tax=Cryobacterium cryoconiti TaxID=1259239 RepID=A0A4Y8JRE8_9MICO|nr:hypothetical protein [Cryobacterium cryoconiti]TFD27498.1 hypothetical protein E3T49_13225 [Cryobacterium cryoconiti]
MTAEDDAAWAHRETQRGASRSCNPRTEFLSGRASRDAEVAELRDDLEVAEGILGAHAHAVPQIIAERDSLQTELNKALGLMVKAYRNVDNDEDPAAILVAHDAAIARRTLHAFADRLRNDYALDHSSAGALLKHVESLARRDGDLNAGA